MSLAYERNTDLAYDTSELEECGKRYSEIADELDEIASKLDSLLDALKSSGWTTPAGSALHKMVNTKWQYNINRYTSLLRTLHEVMRDSSEKYDDLTGAYIETVNL